MLADFLRSRRAQLQPEDVGLPRAPRRRSNGLRREEVAELAGISADYYSRIEQQRGPRPSEPLLNALADGLRLTDDERDHLFRLAGFPNPPRHLHDRPAAHLLRVMRQLEHTPAQICSHLGETLHQNALSIAVFGDHSRFAGLRRFWAYRWFLEPGERLLYAPQDHDRISRAIVAEVLATHSAGPSSPDACALVEQLLAQSPEYAEVWAEHPVFEQDWPRLHLRHPIAGALELNSDYVVDSDRSQFLAVFTADPGSADEEKLRSLLRAAAPGSSAP
ncbi:helix-turn-helix domain-containing protein [Kribbella sandramycini]|nr:helix-turn-helix transcriptional regulator [Kribbella sandramycini]NOL42780.1 helix-turn-helix domain-containing protein [Kribbella sandramycini]